MTDSAIISVLKFLGMRHVPAYLIMCKYENYSSVSMFEEIRHHELRLIYPNIYTQRVYFNDKAENICPKCSHPLDGNYCWKCRAMTGEKI